MTGQVAQLLARLEYGQEDRFLGSLYGQEELPQQRERYRRLLVAHCTDDGNSETLLFSAPGRTELAGNHTDHNGGSVLAAAINLDIIAAVTPCADRLVTVTSPDTAENLQVDLESLEPRPVEEQTAQGLVRGVAAGLAGAGIIPGGCRVTLQATLPVGKGLSSSAAFAVLFGAILARCWHDNDEPDRHLLAAVARQAEADYFGKPCGLMDQMASSLGNVLALDFGAPERVHAEIISRQFVIVGYRLVVIDAGGDHSQLTAEYRAIPEEMRAAAASLGGSCGRDIDRGRLLANVALLRERVGDRAVLRLLHFVEEQQRVTAMVEALRTGASRDFLRLVDESGHSSCQLLQNCVSMGSPRQQSILLALAMSRRIAPQAICRVHGGGFAGTVQAYVPESTYPDYAARMAAIFGAGAVVPLIAGRPGVCGLKVSGPFWWTGGGQAR